jgi:hypothetical protein
MKRSFITLLFVLTCVLGGTGVRAEAFFDLYAGWARTDYSLGRVTVPTVFVSGIGNPDVANQTFSSIEARTNFEASVTAGLRGGYWFGNWFGLAVDAFYFQPDIKSADFTPQGADVKVFPISALFLFRWPFIRSERYPLGRLHPYAGAGPSLFITTFDGVANLDVFPYDEFKPLDTLSSTNVDPGLETVAGLDFLFLPFMGVFAEYKYTLANPVWKDDVAGTSTEYSVPLRTHHFVGGFTFRF